MHVRVKDKYIENSLGHHTLPCLPRCYRMTPRQSLAGTHIKCMRLSEWHARTHTHTHTLHTPNAHRPNAGLSSDHKVHIELLGSSRVVQQVLPMSGNRFQRSGQDSFLLNSSAGRFRGWWARGKAIIAVCSLDYVLYRSCV